MNIYIKYTLIILFFSVLLIGCVGKKINQYEWVKTLPAPWKLSQSAFENFLPIFHGKYPNFHDRLTAISLWRVGTPYKAFCLGEENGIDKDPLIRIDSSDCTIHVLTSIAFAESFSWQDSRESITKIHYKKDANIPPKPDYKLRWHYTSDRLLNHRRTPDITSKVIDKNFLKFVEIDLNIKQDGTEFLDLDWSLNEKIGYIPIDKVSVDILKQLPSICGVAFIKEAYFKMGVVIAHEGFLINGKNLVHASSEKKMTVNIDFLTYLIKDDKPRFDGLMFYKINQE